MSRATPSQVVTNLSGAHFNAFPLVEMQFASGTAYASGTAFNVPYGGNTYIGLQMVGKIDVISETDAEVKGLAFTLSGVLPANISLALAENVTKRPVIVRFATLDASGAVTVDPNVWQGYMDTMSILDSGPSSTIRVTAEHKMAAWRQPKIVRFTDEDQRRRAPGDGLFKHIAVISEKPIVWPGAEFFKR